MSVTPRLTVVANQPPELLVFDEPGPCAYLPEETWRLPLRLPVRQLTREEFGTRLATGDRRQGRLLYRTACPSCRACEPIRLEVARFQPDKTQRRILRRGDRELRVECGPPVADADRVRLYNLHKFGRGLALGEHATDLDTYRAFLGESCCETFELRYFRGTTLVAVALVDRADDALSAVYFYWDPVLSSLSPGVFSILKQVELCRSLGLGYLYLGLFIGPSAKMAYKGLFLPHERLIGGHWVEDTERPQVPPRR
ncbi:MAG: arginyltransferase [Myxococcales bacterium]|nr:arginyltransferase [Myxococcales bacterium]